MLLKIPLSIQAGAQAAIFSFGKSFPIPSSGLKSILSLKLSLIFETIFKKLSIEFSQCPTN